MRMIRDVGPVLAMALALAAAAHAAEGGHPHRFQDAERWSKVFDDPSRDEWQKPDEVVRALKLAPDAVVADIGAGTGYFAMRLARAVPQGRVYAIDTETDMVGHLARRAREAGLANVRAVQAVADDPRLPEKADAILFVNVYHHVQNRQRYFSRLRDLLRPDGRLVVVDFRRDAPVGPPRSVRIAPDVVTRELRQAGYALAAEHDFLPHQYYLVFRPDGAR
jgi:cyclopropane fatty-acyl-phospholipid synthase-like methyltransferase